MASPKPNTTSMTGGGASAPSTQPISPAGDDRSTSQQPQPANPATTAAGNTTSTPTVANPPQVPATSLQDSGKSRRPQDARLMHMLLASLGVSSYQERVPLQLLDFAYRYTASTLQDAIYLATEGYPGEQQGGKSHPQPDSNTVSLGALRMSIASRLHYQFQPGLPKEFLMDLAAERNRVMLPGVSRGQDVAASAASSSDAHIMMGGMRLPPERFCLTGVGWDLKDEWESEGEEEMELDGADQQKAGAASGEQEEGGDEDDDADGKMEDIFGHGGDGGEKAADEDKEMTDV